MTASVSIESFFARLGAAFVVTDPALRIVEVNPALCAMFGYDAAHLIGCPISTLFCDSAAWAVPERLPPGGDQLYASLRRADGNRFAAQITRTDLCNSEGAPLGFGALIRNLTDDIAEQGGQVRSLEQRAAEFSMLHSQYRRTPAMLHSIDEEGCLLDVSDKWLARLGYTREEVIGRRSTEFLSPDSQAFAKSQVLPEFWRTGRCDAVPYTMLSKSGEPIDVELSAVLDTLGDATCTLAILVDVTDRNAIMRDLQKRNEDLSNFAHVAAHDLQSPLRHIGIFSDMCAEEIEAGNLDEARKFLSTVQTASGRLASLIDSLLAYAQAEQVVAKPEQIGLGDVICEALAAQQARIEATEADVSYGPMPKLSCDPALLGQALSQMIANALTYVAPGVQPCIRIEAEAADGETVIRMRDNGIGIDPQFWQRIFLPMRRLHGKDGPYQGDGVGLALCKLLVEAHGGRIEVEESDASGTVFRLTLQNTPLRKTICQALPASS